MMHYSIGSIHARIRSFQPVPHSAVQLTSLLHLVPSCTNWQARKCLYHCSASNTAGVSGNDNSGDLSRLSPEAFLASRRASTPRGSGPGSVYLVGTGPGDPFLLTLRAVHLMQSADVVLYDRLVSHDILRLVHAGAKMVYVGKEAGLHTRSQDEIHALLCQFAEKGSTVLRLKGGDPFIFGRGGEEAEYLRRRGISVHCVPGITAASGICADLGIPMTHRGLATSVRFLTGHSREGGEEELDASMQTIADAHTTLVVYMGLGTLPKLSQQLQTAGCNPDMPAVAIERGTTPEQRTVFAPLCELASEVAAARLKSPTLIIIGEVVALSPGWGMQFSTGSLTGSEQIPLNSLVTLKRATAKYNSDDAVCLPVNTNGMQWCNDARADDARADGKGNVRLNKWALGFLQKQVRV